MGLCSLLVSSVVFAGGSPGELCREARNMLARKDFDAAIPVIQEYLEKVKDSKLPNVIQIAQDMRFKLASILIEKNRMDEAIPVLQEYVSYPIGKQRTAAKMLASCLYETKRYNECITAVTNAFALNESVAVASVVKKGHKGKLETVNTGKTKDPEYTDKELVSLHMFLAESLFNLSHWQECIPPYEYVINNTDDDQRKGLAIMQIINALIKIPDFDRIMAWIPKLYQSDARYNIRVNMALMNVADTLYYRGDYDSALPLYRMIVPKDELLAFQEKKLKKMRIEKGLAPAEHVEMTADEELLFGDDSDTTPQANEEEEKPKEVKTPPEIARLERLVEALRAMPPYENNVAFRMAQLYRKVDRYWEALTFFIRVYQAEPNGDLGASSIREALSVMLEDLNERAQAEQYAFDYLAKHREGLAPRLVAYQLSIYYQKNKEMKAILALRPYVDSLVHTNDETVLTYDAELMFVQAVANMMTMNYKQSEKDFKYVLDKFPKSRQKDNASYWYGMSILFQQRYNEAYPIFEAYLKNFPKGAWVPNANFQLALCLFGMEKYEEAKKQFSYVIEHFPDSSIFPDACSMRGDLYGADGKLEEALADYKMAIDAARTKTKKVKQATYPVFKSAEIYDAWDGQYNEIVNLVQQYLDDWGDQADVAKALYWIGKTRIQQGFVDEAVDSYISAILKYGSNLQQDGVDMMISELVKISTIWLGVDKQQELLERIDQAIALTADPTTKLRLRVLAAKLTHTESELGEQLIKELPSLDAAPPPVLAVICSASFEKKDYSRAKEILEIFQSKYEDSQYMRDAYKLRAFGQFEQNDYEGALDTIRQAQETYGTEPDVAWAQLMKGQILLAQGKIEEARKCNEAVLGEPNWRGAPTAQATYQLGQVEEAAGNYLKAFGFYQRTYFQYKGHANGYWAAEAYLASARCLKQLGMEEEVKETYRAMLYDTFVNTLPQAEVARKYLGPTEVSEITAYLDGGGTTNITIAVQTAESVEEGDTETVSGAETNAPPEDTPEPLPAAESASQLETEGK